jgi:penicillin-binding protein 1A
MSLSQHPFFLRLREQLPPRRWQRWLIGLFGLFVAGLLAFAMAALVLLPSLPAIDALNENPFKVPLRVYSAEGVLMAEFGDEKRIPVRIEEVPPTLVQAILAAEDASFYYHNGVDFPGIARAAWANLRAGRVTEGASTITMQVARNYFLTPEKTLTRKLKEVLLAFKIERELGKNEILELYVNKIFLGNRAYGFAAAAQVYFGKTLGELSLAEIATLAGLPKAPSRTNPLNNPDNALERRAYVLKRMLKLGSITPAAYEEALAAPMTVTKHVVRQTLEASYVAEMVRLYMIQKYADATYADGYHVYTTVRAAHQQAANAALRKGLLDYDRRHGWRGPAGHVRLDGRERRRLDEALKDYAAVAQMLPAIVTEVRDKSAAAYTQEGETVELPWAGLAWAQPHINEDTLGPAPRGAGDVLRIGDIVYVEHLDDGGWRLAQVPKANAALVSLATRDGAILALAGGLDFYHSSYNHVLQAERQPGSSIKPFIFAAALDKGFTAATTVSGAPIVVADVSIEDEWRPEDYSRQFFGPTRLRKALALSLNLVAVRLLRAIGPEYASDYMARFGFDRRKFPANLSLALGAAAATPLQMTSAYGVFATGGHRLEPYFITRIEDARRNIIEEANPAVVCPDCEPDGELRYAERVLGAENAFLMTSMMRDVITSGTGQLAQSLERKDLAGKTGTTNDHRDAWFAGYNSDLVATAWIGFDQPAPLGRGETGAKAALPIWIGYMREALRGLPERKLVRPEGVTTAWVHRETGRPTHAGDPNGMEEYFIEGMSSDEPLAAEDAGSATLRPAPVEGSVREGLF